MVTSFYTENRKIKIVLVCDTPEDDIARIYNEEKGESQPGPYNSGWSNKFASRLSSLAYRCV